MAIPEDFQLLEGFYLPEEFWPAVGYQGEARWAATYWKPAGDEAEFNDGQLSGTGDWQAFLLLVDHPPNRAILNSMDARWWLGSSDFPATRWLVGDRQDGQAYLAPVQSAYCWLRRQWPDYAVVVTEKDVAELIELNLQRLARMPPLTEAEFLQFHREQEARLATLRAALNRN